MFRTSVQIVLAVVLLLGMAGVSSASAGEMTKAPAVAGPLPFLSSCPAMSRVAPPVGAKIDLQSLSPAPATCTGCSGHNCFFQAVGSVCMVDGRRGRCTEIDTCPDLRETSCTCQTP